MRLQKKVLIEIKVDNVVDIITNSSSELFILSGDTKEIVQEMVSDVYPNYLNEYEQIVSLREADDDQIDTYIDQVENRIWDIWEATKNMSEEEKRLYRINVATEVAKKYKMTPDEYYVDWEDTKNKKYFYPQASKEGLRKAAEFLDPNRQIFLMFSIDENPDWDYQEKLMEIGTRYHLG